MALDFAPVAAETWTLDSVVDGRGRQAAWRAAPYSSTGSCFGERPGGFPTTCAGWSRDPDAFYD